MMVVRISLIYLILGGLIFVKVWLISFVFNKGFWLVGYYNDIIGFMFYKCKKCNKMLIW